MHITYKRERVNGEWQWVRENKKLATTWVMVPLALHFLLKSGVVHAAEIFGPPGPPHAAGLLAATFASGGAGFAIVQLLAIAAFAALACFVLQFLGKGQIAGLVTLVAGISCVGLVIGVVGSALGSIASLFHLTL